MRFWQKIIIIIALLSAITAFIIFILIQHIIMEGG